jgi:isopropylmalate/homocitrate/citramalate synthase
MSTPWMKDGEYWVAPTNFADEVVAKHTFPEKIEVLDTSLRDGEQQPGITFTKDDKVAIAKRLAEVGVHRIEVATPAVSKADQDAVREIVDLNLGPKIFVFVRNMIDDMKLAKSLGVHGVIAEVPGSEHLLKFGKNWTADKAIKSAIEATSYAHEEGLYVNFFPADGSRADLNFLIDTVGQVAEGGHMDSLALVDTFGAYSPEGAAYTVKKLKENFSQPIEVHFHDDFGLGVANTIAGLAAGAEVCHMTINGIGERAGSASYEQLCLALKVLYGYDTGIKLDKMLALSRMVEELSNFKVQPNRAVVGEQLFGWETGMPVSLWVNSRDKGVPLAMLPYMWTMTGNTEPKIYMGKKSGKDNVKEWLKPLNTEVSDEQATEILQKVKDKALSIKRDLTRDEFKAIVEEAKA